MCMASMRESRGSDRFKSTHKYNHMYCCAEGLALQCLSLSSYVVIALGFFLIILQPWHWVSRKLPKWVTSVAGSIPLPIVILPRPG